MKLLIIENDLLVLKTIEIKFRTEGFTVVCCRDFSEGVSLIKSELPDIVLSGIDNDPRSALEIIRFSKSVTSKQITAFLLAKPGQEEAVETAFTIGLDDFVKKPFSIAELMIRIRRFTSF
ncbi:response regulator transcription factor [Rubrolithibacter danxiaensis]|uniref:response regulator transcription factor n=1 Tax=Rubrolithibacter danxiaensis TaxID=3390805 RepID=UPI003BF84F96